MEKDGNIYCDEHYDQKFIPKCFSCGNGITGKAVTVAALSRQYHFDHFKCEACSCDLITNGGYREHQGKIYCEKCDPGKPIPVTPPPKEICYVCKENLSGNYVEIDGQKAHVEHFKCYQCGVPLKGKQLQRHQGHFFCEEHYNAIARTKCNNCNEIIVGKRVTAMGKDYHAGCFVCIECKVPFGGNVQFYESPAGPLCETHHSQKSNKCASCNQPAFKQIVELFGKTWHKECFDCQVCHTSLGQADTVVWNYRDKPTCKKCYEGIPEKERDTWEKEKDSL
jgi:hypothetical protein